MFFYLLIFFRVITPNQYKTLGHIKRIKDQVVKGCDELNGDTIENQSHSKTEYYYCTPDWAWETKSTIFRNCTFKNIQMLKNDESYLIHPKNAHLEIDSCQFTEIIYSNRMIYFQTSATTYDYAFVFKSNIISSCNSRTDNARVVYTDSEVNDIQYNSITFDTMISHGQGFYLYYTKQATEFSHNTVTNAICDKGSAIYTYK